MNTFLGIIGVLLFSWVLWRLFSRRYSWPCPSWLSALVEMDNPFVKTAQAATILQHLDLQPGMVIVDLAVVLGGFPFQRREKSG